MEEERDRVSGRKPLCKGLHDSQEKHTHIEIRTGALDALEQSALPGAGHRAPEKALIHRRELQFPFKADPSYSKVEKITSWPGPLSAGRFFQTMGEGEL